MFNRHMDRKGVKVTRRARTSIESTWKLTLGCEEQNPEAVETPHKACSVSACVSDCFFFTTPNRLKLNTL